LPSSVSVGRRPEPPPLRRRLRASVVVDGPGEGWPVTDCDAATRPGVASVGTGFGPSRWGEAWNVRGTPLRWPGCSTDRAGRGGDDDPGGLLR